MLPPLPLDPGQERRPRHVEAAGEAVDLAVRGLLEVLLAPGRLSYR
jgi:hypothetical protein